jgi:hypothetical protein
MIITNNNGGRLGNSIFRLFANIIFCIIYDINSKIVNNSNCRPNIVINDKSFINFSNNIINKRLIKNINKNSTLLFDGYFQHDTIYILFKPQIINFIKNHPEIILTTDRNEKYKAIDLVNINISNKKYNIVVHLRLEDFIEISHVMNPLSVKKIIDNLVSEYPNETICFVLNSPKTEIENKYINFLTKNLSNYKIESNDVITDFTIMRNAKTLICSCSTLSWAASFLSETVEKVYMPNYNNPDRIHETFKQPISNTVLYDFEKCSREKLLEIISI